MEYRDYYKILGVDRKATQDEIKSAYRKLAMKYHPDRNRGDSTAEDKFKDINEAYQVLSNEENRQKYDQLGSSYKDWKQRGGQGDFNWGDWMRQNQGAGGGRPQYTYQTNVGDMGSFSDFFSRIFGAGFSGGSDPLADLFMQGNPQQAQYAMPPIDQPIEISLAEAYYGTERAFMVGNRRITVKIPRGAKTGTKVRVAGAGPDGRDIYLLVTVADDPVFERDGNDLIRDIEVDLYTALLGGSATVKTMDGTVELKIPAGTQPGRKIRLQGKGMPKLKNKDQFGDLYARVQVTLPKQLTAHQKKLFEELRNGSA
jgi:curved DNA-binding protein